MAWDRSRRREFGLKIRNIRWMIIVVVGLFYLSQSYWRPLFYNWRCHQIADKLNTHYGLIVRFENPSDFFVPPLTPLVNVPEKGFSIDQTEVRYAQTALKGVRNALSHYPKDLIKTHLKAVFIAGEIKSHGIQIGGSYFYSWIYLSALESYESAGPNLYSLNLHHELSSLFMEGGHFPRERWQAINESDFKYLPTQKDVVHSAAQENRRDPKDESLWFRAGFVHDYGMSSLENDFNMYAELAMTDPAKLKQLGLQYPKINAKTQILVEFYSSLAPEMATYFESAGLIERLAVK